MATVIETVQANDGNFEDSAGGKKAKVPITMKTLL